MKKIILFLLTLSLIFYGCVSETISIDKDSSTKETGSRSDETLVDPFQEPIKLAEGNCGPEDRYVYPSDLLNKEEIRNFLEDVMDNEVSDTIPVPLKEIIPLQLKRFNTEDPDFPLGLSDEEIVMQKTDSGKIYNIHIEHKTPNCYDDIIVSSLGEISVYGCCGI